MNLTHGQVKVNWRNRFLWEPVFLRKLCTPINRTRTTWGRSRDRTISSSPPYFIFILFIFIFETVRHNETHYSKQKVEDHKTSHVVISHNHALHCVISTLHFSEFWRFEIAKVYEKCVKFRIMLLFTLPLSRSTNSTHKSTWKNSKRAWISSHGP